MKEVRWESVNVDLVAPNYNRCSVAGATKQLTKSFFPYSDCCPLDAIAAELQSFDDVADERSHVVAVKKKPIRHQYMFVPYGKRQTV